MADCLSAQYGTRTLIMMYDCALKKARTDNSPGIMKIYSKNKELPPPRKGAQALRVWCQGKHRHHHKSNKVCR